MEGLNAVVLAAGFGKRLLPLTEECPKPLVPLFGRPLIDYALARLARLPAPPEVVAVNLHHLPDAIRAHVGDGRRWGLAIQYSLESPDILGTGGALRRLEGVLGRGPFLVSNGDVFFDAPLEELLAVGAQSSAVAGVVGLARDPERPELNLVALDGAGRVRSIGGRPGTAPEGTEGWVFAGAHLLRPRIFDHLPAEGFACVVRDGYIRMMAAGMDVRGVAFPQRAWHDVGTPASYLRAHWALFPQLGALLHMLGEERVREHAPGIWLHRDARVAEGATLVAPVFVDAGARVEAGATVGPFAVLGSDAVAHSGCRVTRSVFWESAEIEGEFDSAILSESQAVLTGSVKDR